MKRFEPVRKRGKYYPDKPFDPYNRYPYASIKDVRDEYGDFVESTEGYSYFIVWIKYVPSNKPKVELFVDKEDVNRYTSDYDYHPSEWSKDSLHYCEGTNILAINGRSAEELNNYIAKILMDFYNKRIYEYIEKNKPQSCQSSPSNHHSTPVKPQTSQFSTNAHADIPERRDTSNNVSKKTRTEVRMELIRKLLERKRSGVDSGLSDFDNADK